MKLGKIEFLTKRVIGDVSDPLLVRYVIFRQDYFGIFLHKLCRSDHARALHDHPWTFVSVVLRRGYLEITDNGSKLHRPGAILFRPALWRHRVVIEEGKPAWTLVFLGKRVRKWGFWPDGRWCWWRKYNDATGICEEGVIHQTGRD